MLFDLRLRHIAADVAVAVRHGNDAADRAAAVHADGQRGIFQSVTILRMEVPCCGGLEMAAKKALQASGKFIPWQVVTISIDGKILD